MRASGDRYLVWLTKRGVNTGPRMVIVHEVLAKSATQAADLALRKKVLGRKGDLYQVVQIRQENPDG